MLERRLRFFRLFCQSLVYVYRIQVYSSFIFSFNHFLKNDQQKQYVEVGVVFVPSFGMKTALYRCQEDKI